MTIHLPPKDLIALPDIARILHALQSPQHSWLTGGTVRDSLFTQHHPLIPLPSPTVPSLDIATSLPLDTVIHTLHKLNLSLYTLYPRYSSLSVTIHHKLHADIATLRIDLSSDGRQALIAPATQISQDCLRRDFTINALYLDSKGQIFDFHQGQNDIILRQLRFVSPPHISLAQDHLRILRFLRFISPFHHSSIPFSQDIILALSQHAHSIQKLSPARKGQEIKGLLSTPKPSKALLLIQSLKINPFFTPLIPPQIPQNIDSLDSWHQRLATLVSSNAKLPELFAQFEFSKSDKKLIRQSLLNLTHDGTDDPP